MTLFSITLVVPTLTEGLALSVLDYRSRLEQDSQGTKGQGCFGPARFHSNKDFKRINPHVHVGMPPVLFGNCRGREETRRSLTKRLIIAHFRNLGGHT